MSEKYEDVVRPILAAMTPGPWWAEGCGGIQMDGTRDGFLVQSENHRRIAALYPTTTSRHEKQADASGIVLLRNTAEPMLAVVEAAREAITQAEAFSDDRDKVCIICPSQAVAEDEEIEHVGGCAIGMLVERLARLDEAMKGAN